MAIEKSCKLDDKSKINEIFKKYMYLVEMSLNKFDYDKQDYEDLLQDGYERLIILIKKYILGTYKHSLNIYLNNSLKHYYKTRIKKMHKEEENFYLNYVDSNKDDFITKLEEKEYIGKLEEFLFETYYLTFLQKNIIMARIGYINNIMIDDHELASAFSCSSSNINHQFNCWMQVNLPRRFRNRVSFKNNYSHFTDLFSFFETTEEIVRYFINDLTLDEIMLLKKVWGNNYDNIKGIKYANIGKEEVIEYYTVIHKLYDKITSCDVFDIMRKTGIDSFEILRKTR